MPLRLLIADDDPVMRMVLGAIVRADPDIEVIAEAEDADQAISLAAQHRPDVALLDVEMPAGGGLRAAQEISSRHPEIRLVALSAHETSETRAAMTQAGVAGYLTKTAPPADVLKALKG